MPPTPPTTIAELTQDLHQKALDAAKANHAAAKALAAYKKAIRASINKP